MAARMAGPWSTRHGRTFLFRVICMAAVVLLVVANVSDVAAATVQSGGYSNLRAVGVRRFSRSPAGTCRESEYSSSDHSGEVICCNGVCVDVSKNVQSCGACNNQCAFNRECCSGVCVDTHASDPLNCGSCGRVCSDGVPCLFGMCGYSSGRIIIP